MFKWFRKKKTLQDVLQATKKVEIHGVEFVIKRLDPMAHLEGFKVLYKLHEIYQNKKNTKPVIEDEAKNLKKLQDALSHILVAGVVNPPLSFKEEEGKVCVKNLFLDMKLSQALAEEILGLMYGKKN